jgi:hypothetical protein
MQKTSLLNQLLDPLKTALTPEVAARIDSLRADEQTQAKLDELADKAQEGMLTLQDQRDYDDLLSAIDLITILQIKARAVLRDHAKAS